MSHESPQQPPHPLRARIIGAVLLILGGGCVYWFTQHVNDTLLAVGFPRAWAGAPALLGAALFGITGGFMLILRRFSLAGLLSAAIVAAILAAGGQAYVNNIHTVETEKFVVYDSGYMEQSELISAGRNALTPERLTNFASELANASEPKSALDFYSLSISFGASQGNSSEIIVTLNFDCASFMQTRPIGIRRAIRDYCQLMLIAIALEKHPEHWSSQADAQRVAQMCIDPNGLSTFMDGDAYDLIVDVNGYVGTPTWGGNRKTHDSILWLRDHESDTRLKQFFTEILTEFDALMKKRKW